MQEVAGSLDRPIDVIHLGTRLKLAMETAEYPTDIDDLTVVAERTFGLDVVLGTHAY